MVNRLEGSKHSRAVALVIDRTCRAFKAASGRIGVQTNDENITQLRRVLEQVNVTTMENIEHAVREYDGPTPSTPRCGETDKGRTANDRFGGHASQCD